MSNATALLVLLVAALLEAGGDALVRSGLHAAAPAAKVSLILAGGLVLLAYGITVNAPPWDFGRLLGVYVVLFFAAAQAINTFAFQVPLTTPIVAGGALILAGGLLMTFWH